MNATMTGTVQTVSEVDESTVVVEFATAVPGFPGARTWTLEVWGDDPSSPFTLMRNVEVEGLEFVVISPVLFFPDYEPDLDGATVDALGLEEPEDAIVFVVLNIGETIEETTANLLGPIVINRHTNKASQAILNQKGLSTKTPLVPTQA